MTEGSKKKSIFVSLKNLEKKSKHVLFTYRREGEKSAPSEKRTIIYPSLIYRNNFVVYLFNKFYFCEDAGGILCAGGMKN